MEYFDGVKIGKWVDELQGSERGVVIVSVTRSNARGDIGFLRDDRILNVAFFRAQHFLIIVGDFSTFHKCLFANFVVFRATPPMDYYYYYYYYYYYTVFTCKQRRIQEKS